MEYHKVLKEIHLSYFHNIIKFRSEYFEYGISHFPRNQPRTTLGFAWKPIAARGKCHRTAIPASLFPQGHEQEPHTPSRLPQLFPPPSARLKTQLPSALPSSATRASPNPSCRCWCDSALLRARDSPLAQGTPKLSADEYIGRANAQH